MTILIIAIVVLILVLWLTRPGRIRGMAQNMRVTKERVKDELVEAREELAAPQDELEPLPEEPRLSREPRR